MRLPSFSVTILTVAAVGIIFVGAMGTGTLVFGQSGASVAPPAQIQAKSPSRTVQTLFGFAPMAMEVVSQPGVVPPAQIQAKSPSRTVQTLYGFAPMAME